MFQTFLHYLTLPFLLRGAVTAVELWIYAFSIATIFGLLLALIRHSNNFPAARWVVASYIWVVRGTPLLLQLIIWYNVLPPLGIRIDEFWTGVIALSVCYSAYMCEVFRSGLLAVDRGQIHAARSLGFGVVSTIRLFIIPQAFHVALPSLANFAIMMVKDSSLTSVIAVSELTLRANTIVAQNFDYVPVFGAALVIYLALTSILTAVGSYMERYFDYGLERHAKRGHEAFNETDDSIELKDFLTTSDSSTSVESAVTFSNVSKRFGSKEIFHGVTLDIAAGKTTCIIGQSGSGKSTLLKMINGLEVPDHGEIFVNGVQITEREIRWVPFRRSLREARLTRLRRRAQTAMVFQQFDLFVNFSVLGNIMVAARHVLKMPRWHAVKRAKVLLRLLGLLDLQNRSAVNLSGGEKQRIAILRALSIRPKTLLFDEPTSALDPERVGEVLEVIRRLSDAGGTLVIVTHEMEFARQCADWVIFMEDGVIVEQGTPELIFESPSSQRTREFISGVRRETASGA